MLRPEIRIRPFTQADFAAVLAWFPTEAALVQWGGPDLVHPLDAAQLERMLAENQTHPPKRALWTGLLEQTVAAHAQVALDPRHGVARLARIGIAPACRGQGLAVPFLTRVIDQVFADPGYERLELNVYTFNAAAIRTYRRLGFTQEGVRRSSVRVGDERWDTAMFGLLRSERPTAA